MLRGEEEAPAWETIIAGNWSGRWDLSVGSMTITPEREEVLHFSTPYYFTPAVVVVGEPTNMEAVNGHKGIATFHVTVTPTGPGTMFGPQAFVLFLPLMLFWSGAWLW